MPFIEVKMWTGRTESQKAELIERLTSATTESVGCPKEAVQIAIQEISKENWGIAGKAASES